MFKQTSLLLFIFFTFISCAYLDSYPSSRGGCSGGSSRSSSSRSFSYPKSSSSSHGSVSSYHRSSHYSRSSNQHNQDQKNESEDSASIILWFVFMFVFIFFLSLKWLIDNAAKGDKHHVYKDYDEIANWFDKNRSREGYEKIYLDQVLEKIPLNGTILDLGCGMAEPVTQYLLEKKYEVTGVDGSQKLLALAHKRYPHTTFIHADMRLINLNKKFDAIILWHSFFHLSHVDQRRMFRIFVQHLKLHGILLFTSGPSHGEIWSDNGGIDIYHASLSEYKYKDLLNQYGFELILHVVEDKDCGGATVWIAQLNKFIQD